MNIKKNSKTIFDFHKYVENHPSDKQFLNLLHLVDGDNLNHNEQAPNTISKKDLADIQKSWMNYKKKSLKETKEEQHSSLLSMIKEEKKLIKSCPSKILYASALKSDETCRLISNVYDAPVDVFLTDSVSNDNTLNNTPDLVITNANDDETSNRKINHYELIYIDISMPQKWKFLHLIRKQGSPNTQVICRVPLGFARLLYDDNTINEFYPHPQVICKNDPLLGSIILPSLVDIHYSLTFTWKTNFSEGEKFQIIELMNNIMQYEPSIGFPGPIAYEKSLEIVTNIESKVQEREMDYLYLEVGGMFLGQVVLTYRRSPNNKHIADVTRTFFSPYIRSKENEMETKVLLSLLEKCQEQNIECLCIDTKKGSSAEKKWRQIGFKIYGILPDYSRINGESFDGVYMFMDVNKMIEKLNSAP